MKIGIFTDSAVDLTKEICFKNDITVVPFTITFEGNVYIDNETVSVQTLIEAADKNKKLPKTSQITPVEYMDYFNEGLRKYDDIIYIGISTKFSGTVNSARLAVSEMNTNRIHIIDSKNLSSGIGLLVLKACKWRDLGKSVSEICSEVERCKPLVRTQFAINTLTYLHMGGRCSGTALIFGTLLKIKPIIKVVDGAMLVAKKPIGSYKKALDLILNDVFSDIGNIDEDNVMITHCLASDDAVYLREKLNERLHLDNVLETYAGVTVSTHCGPRTIGILYIAKK